MVRKLASPLTNKEFWLADVASLLATFGFDIGGNWDYEHGYLDKSLDDKNQIWLRIPFQVISGRFEGIVDSHNTKVRLGTPFVLHHRYNNSLDKEAKVHVVNALWDQFQAPIEPDAEVDEHWMVLAKEVIDEIDQSWEAIQS